MSSSYNGAFERVSTTDDGEPLVDAFVAAQRELLAIAAECTTGSFGNAGDRARRLNEAIGSVTATREAIEMRIYDLALALNSARIERDELQRRLDETIDVERDLRAERAATTLITSELRAKLDECVRFRNALAEKVRS